MEETISGNLSLRKRSALFEDKFTSNTKTEALTTCLVVFHFTPCSFAKAFAI